jgi:hypothetical protein
MMRLVTCPHCIQCIEIVELNCRIFRCGIFKNTYKQVDPHLCEAECKRLFESGLIYGCGKPFYIQDSSGNELVAVKCDYI